MTIWNVPTTEVEADAIIAMAKETIPNLIEDDLEIACREMALFAGSFNHVWTRLRRQQLIEILVGVGFDAIDPVLQVLTDSPRAEQFDVTQAFIRRLVEVTQE
jgi:hypothetical protein